MTKFKGLFIQGLDKHGRVMPNYIYWQDEENKQIKTLPLPMRSADHWTRGNIEEIFSKMLEDEVPVELRDKKCPTIVPDDLKPHLSTADDFIAGLGWVTKKEFAGLAVGLWNDYILWLPRSSDPPTDLKFFIKYLALVKDGNPSVKNEKDEISHYQLEQLENNKKAYDEFEKRKV